MTKQGKRKKKNMVDAAAADAVLPEISRAAYRTEECPFQGIEAFLAAELFCSECVSHTHTFTSLYLNFNNPIKIVPRLFVFAFILGLSDHCSSRLTSHLPYLPSAGLPLARSPSPMRRATLSSLCTIRHLPPPPPLTETACSLPPRKKNKNNNEIPDRPSLFFLGRPPGKKQQPAF